MTFEELLTEKRPHIDRVVADVARRHYLAPGEIAEFRARVDRALERQNYELLRAFDGRSTWETYLDTVVLRQFFVFQAELWGQWRPSLAAQRRGAEGMLLEELVVRDGMSVAEAVEVMRSRHRVDLPRHRLEALAAELRVREQAERLPDLRDRARDARIQAALRDALSTVSPDDRLILQLRYRDRQPLTRVAGMLKVEARPLQRRIDALVALLRQSLVAQGLAIDDVEQLLRDAEADDAVRQQQWWESVLARPSN